MQGNTVAEKPAAAEGAKPVVKSKKMLIIVGAAVLILALVGGGGFFYISKQRAAAAAEDGGEEPAKAASHDSAKAVPPAYLPMDNMVVNLADQGGERVAQVGITLVVADAHASDSVKAFLPTIRSSVLMLLSQHTAQDLLTAEGKEKLAKEILRAAIVPFGGGEDDHEEEDPAPKKKKKKVAHVEYPVIGVLFSSFIVQ